MKLEKLMDFDEWMRTERRDLYCELVNDYIHEYKLGLAEDCVQMIMEDEEIRYVLPRRIPYNDFIKLLKENDIKIKDIKKIREIH